MDITIVELVRVIKSRKDDDFLKYIPNYLRKGSVVELIRKLDDADIKRTVDICRKDKIFLVHKVFEQIENISDLKFLKTYAYALDKVDGEKRTWLHIAVIHDRSLEVLRHLVSTMKISILSFDDYDYTPLHYYCQKEYYDVSVLRLLIKDQFHLIKHSKDDLTPLEFACSNEENLKKIQELNSNEMEINIKKLLKSIDNICHGVMEVKLYSIPKVFSVDRIWLNLLQKNDKYMVLSYIKNDDRFYEKYYLEPGDIMSIFKKCPENGQGILSFIKERFFKDQKEKNENEIFLGLTGIKVDESSKKRAFHKSALFLALITGRFQLISPLLRCCQFDIVPYALLICLICKRMVGYKRYPDQVTKDICDLKDFCEDYSIAVMNKTYNKDLSKEKKVIADYIKDRTVKLHMKSILEVAYYSKCFKFLSLPCCQESLTKIWKSRKNKCPQITFWIHSIAHLLFLVLFSFVVVNNLFAKISVFEWVCFVYGLGYLVEEVRQVYMIMHDSLIKAYVYDAANSIDLCAILFMAIGFVLRIVLINPTSSEIGANKLFSETRHKHLFFQRLFLCLSLISFFMRVLYFASINPTLGPKLKMISTMIVKDLFPLLFIFIVFLTSFGVAFQSLLYPNSFYAAIFIPGTNATYVRKNLLSIVGDIFRRSTFTIFDFQYTLNEIENNQNNFVTDVHGQYPVYFLLVIFIVVVNVMLMNLLIALFSNTVTQISQQSKQWWKSSRYAFINEYSNRTFAPPPLNIIAIPIEVAFYHIRRAFHVKKATTNVFEEEDHSAIPLTPTGNDIPDIRSISYYIYQAFAMNGQRYRLLKDNKDLEYEKEVHFRNIESKLDSMNEKIISTEQKVKTMEDNYKDLVKIVNERFNALERKYP